MSRCELKNAMKANIKFARHVVSRPGPPVAPYSRRIPSDNLPETSRQDMFLCELLIPMGKKIPRRSSNPVYPSRLRQDNHRVTPPNVVAK